MSVPRWSVYVVVAALIAALSFSFGSLYSAFGTSHGTTYYACLYAGSLSQVSTTSPVNCGRGSQISWNSTGNAGVPGVSGIDGVSGYEIESEAKTVAGGQSFRTSVGCPDDKVALGGGPQLAMEDALLAPDFHIKASYAFNGGERWRVWVLNTGEDSIPFEVVVTCATMAVEAP